MRLAKYLASAGIASRRAAEELIRAGRVSVGGETVREPATSVTDADVIMFDGRPVGEVGSLERVVYAVNKPLGVVSTASDPQGRPTVVSLVPVSTRLYPVGRLDIDTTGLILLTNDGDLAYRLTHPSFEVEKTYRAKVSVTGGGRVPDIVLRQLRRGVSLDDGPSAPARVRRVANDVLELTLHEGRKRQVRRMCEAVGHRVLTLERVRFGPLSLGSLAPGESRRCSEEEISRLQAAGRD
jgi:23S rRNA pseudouridine2605 synthase